MHTYGKLAVPHTLEFRWLLRLAIAPLLAVFVSSCGPAQGSEGGACYGNGTCDEGLRCDEDLCVAMGGDSDGGEDAGLPGDGGTNTDGGVASDLSLTVTPQETYLQPGATIVLKAQVFGGDGRLLLNTPEEPILVDWETSDPEVATVDEIGQVSALQIEPVIITARIRGTGVRSAVHINPGTENVTFTHLPPPEFTDVQMIFLDPPRVALVVGSSRELHASAVDMQGSPTTLDCGAGVHLEYEADFYDAAYNATPGAEHVTTTGLQKGFSLLTLDCGGFYASPVIVEVKPAVTIPDPSPSGNSDFGVDPHFAIGDDEVIHLASFDRANNKLVYTAFSGVWTSEVLDGDGLYGQKPRVILDPLNGNRPMVCAKEGTGLSCWAKGASGFWVKHVVHEAVGPLAYNFDVVTSAEGKITFLFAGEGPEGEGLWLVSSASAARDDWQFRLLAGADATWSSLVLTPDGRLHAAYQQSGVAYYAHATTPDGDIWYNEVIDSGNTSPAPGTYIRLAIAVNNVPQVVYFKNGNVVHAVRSAGTWGIGVVETVNLGETGFGFALDRHRRPRVSYYDASAELLRHAYHTGDRWRVETPSAESGVGSYSYMIVDELGRAQIAYYDDLARKPGFYVEPHYLDYSDVETAGDEPASNTIIMPCEQGCHPAANCAVTEMGAVCGECAPPFLGVGNCECPFGYGGDSCDVPNPGTLEWARRAGGSYSSRARSIAALADGGSVITGSQLEGTFGPGESGETTLVSGDGGTQMYVARYDADGKFVWVRIAEGSNASSEGASVESLSDGSFLVTGWLRGTVTFGPGESGATTLTSVGSMDVFLARYAEDGSLLWARSAGGVSDEIPGQITLLADGGSFITGSFRGTATFGVGENGETVLSSDGQENMFVARYEANGGLAWVRQAVGQSRGNSIVSLPAGGFLIAGGFMGAVTFGSGETAETSLASVADTNGGGAQDIFLARYNADGTLVWVRRAGGQGIDVVRRIALLPDGGAALTGFINLGCCRPGLSGARRVWCR